MLHLQTKRSWFKPHCPQTCKNMCRPLKNPGKKSKRLMLNSIQLNLKNCMQPYREALKTGQTKKPTSDPTF